MSTRRRFRKDNLEGIKHEYFLNACLLNYYMNASSKYKLNERVKIQENIIKAQRQIQERLEDSLRPDKNRSTNRDRKKAKVIPYPINEDEGNVSDKDRIKYEKVVYTCHKKVQGNVVCSVNDGFKAPLKLVEVLKDIVAIKTGNCKIIN